MNASPLEIFNFSKESQLENWYVVDDGVMGGLSQGQMYINEDGNAVFFGDVSLKNNGGFSSIRHSFKSMDIDGYTKAQIRVKGDGKRYQFRIKTDENHYHSYIQYFETSGEWETIELELDQLYPSFRGMELDMPNFPAESMEQISFLIANYKEESFRLEIDYLKLTQ